MMPRLNTRRTLTALLLCAAALGSLAGRQPSATAQTKELRIAFIPYANPKQLLQDVQPVSRFIGRKLGVKVTSFVVLDYAAVVEALRAKRADVAFMGPLQYVLARQEAGAIPILGEKYNGKATYTAKIFVRKNSNIRTLSDLRGKKIAFVDPISSSGFLYPLETFKRAGLIKPGQKPESFFKRIYFAGGEEQAIRAMHNGFVDAAGLGEYSLMLLRPEERDRVRAIATSPTIPSHCVVVRAGLDRSLVRRLESLLLSLEKGPDRKYLKSLYNVDGYVKVTPATYRPVEALARQHGFLK